MLPTIGVLIFCVLYVYAAGLYPGGSQADINSVGFDWMNNYWCNLMNENAINGQKNPARIFAVSSLVILCISLASFFFLFAKNIVKNRIWRPMIQIFGTASMTSAAFIFTPYHDIMTIISSIFGCIAVVGIISTVFKSDLTFFKTTGLICILLLIINNLIYYSNCFIIYLPLIQKITFVLVLSWIIGLNYKMLSHSKK